MKSSYRSWVLLGMIGSLIFLLGGCGSEASKTGVENEKQLKLVTVYPANTTDPHRVHTAFILSSGTMETLVGLNPKTLEAFPWLAESWKTDDAKHWEFKIRKGVKFHNGKELTAEAVKASLERSISVNPGVKAALKIASIEVIDSYTLRITTENSYPSLISGLVHFNSVIMDVNAPEDKPPSGTGAFMFEKFDPSTGAVLIKNPHYWDGMAKLDRVYMTANQDANARLLALQSGDADIIYSLSLESLDVLHKNPKLVIESVPGTRVSHFIYNYAGENRELWNNEEFRKGIDALIDREGIIKTVMANEAQIAFNPFPGNYPFSPALKAREFGKEAALKHFKAAGLIVQDGKVFKNGQPIKLRMATYNARPELPQIAQIVQDSAKQVGIDMEIYVAENIDEFLLAGKFDLVTYSLLAISRGDGAFFLNSSFAPKAVQNHGHLNVPELNNLLIEYNQTVDSAKRNMLAKQFATILEERAYNSYIAAPYATAAYRQGVKGWVTPSNDVEFQMVTKDLDIAPK